MSQSREQVEAQLVAFQAANPDWMNVEWKANTVTGINYRLANFPSKPQYYRSYFFSYDIFVSRIFAYI